MIPRAQKISLSQKKCRDFPIWDSLSHSNYFYVMHIWVSFHPAIIHARTHLLLLTNIVTIVRFNDAERDKLSILMFFLFFLNRHRPP
jgi:hypothetical protein